ncbi:hypothetical protein A4S06_08660 [Erysipelotrichaceae bacterium MTC7]|nr:hypothetical protein A4S06_08660 [Erysipelotrichaceae bacterium MTC7]
MKNFMQDFKAFAMRGNMIDMAVGVVIGGAFGTIINSIVNDLIMPFVALLTDSSEMAKAAIQIGERGGEPVLLKYGAFLQSVINFLIIAFCIFVVVRILGRFQKKKDVAVTKSDEVTLLEEIRDELKKTNKSV